VCLVPAAAAEDYPRPDIAFVPVTDADPAVVSLARRYGHTSRGVEAFIQTVRRVANTRRTGQPDMVA
jgi:hypothetical protein